MALKRTIVAASLMMLAFCFVRQGGAIAALGTRELDTEKVVVAFWQEAVQGGYKVVSTKELKSWIDEKKGVLIVDAMPFEDSYRKQHIPGAVNFPMPFSEMTRMDDDAKAAFGKLLGPDKDRPIVFYCGFTKCARSHNGAMWAVRMGYKNVYRQPGGIRAWSEAGYPMEK